MRKTTILLLATILIASTAWAGGGIFGGHKHRTANPYGVNSINVHVCGNLECPPVRIVEGKCDGANMIMHWGVCLCEAGYVANGATCEACPAGQISDGIHGCQGCPEKTYRETANATTCTPCLDENATACADITGASTACKDGYYLRDGECIENGKCPDGSDSTVQTYQSGTCCTMTHTIWNYCSGDELPTCTRSASCDADESNCTGNYQVAANAYDHICCPAGEDAECADGACTCVPDETPSTQWDCGGLRCTVCSAGEVAKCSSYGGECLCVPAETPNTQYNCGLTSCWICSVGEVAKCSEYDCACGPNSDAVVCSFNVCKVCAVDEVAKCADWGSGENACTCVPSADVTDTTKWKCNDYDCVYCPTGTATCDGDWGECTCTPACTLSASDCASGALASEGGASSDVPTRGVNGAADDEADVDLCGGESSRPGACSVCLSTGESTAHWFDSDALCTATGQTCVNGTCVTSAVDEPTFSDPLCKCMEAYGGHYCGGDSGHFEPCSSDADCAKYGTWDEGTSQCVVDAFCTNNGDCASDEYCHYTSADNNTCKPNKKGTCVAKADAKGDFASGITAEEDGFIRSTGQMNWFTAQNFCRSYGKNLVTLNTFGLSFSGSDCSGNTECGLTDESGTGGLTPAQKWLAIKAKFGKDFYPWTANLVPGSSCPAFYVYLRDTNASVTNYKRSYDTCYALCK